MSRLRDSTLLRELWASCRLASEEDFERYPAAIHALREHPSERVLRGLFLCLRDVEGGEIQYELVEACEAYSPELYARVMVQVSGRVNKIAPFWFRLMLQSAVNDEATRTHLVASTVAASPSRRRVVQLLASTLAQEHPTDIRYTHFLDDVTGRTGAA